MHRDANGSARQRVFVAEITKSSEGLGEVWIVAHRFVGETVAAAPGTIFTLKDFFPEPVEMV